MVLKGLRNVEANGYREKIWVKLFYYVFHYYESLEINFYTDWYSYHVATIIITIASMTTTANMIPISTFLFFHHILFFTFLDVSLKS